ncbi:MAG: hypothetical protein LQ345_001152 [Seirophora villosa]|nr:MAG: hypothetical protein LQ345_001152 [Seirophora villosa]
METSKKQPAELGANTSAAGSTPNSPAGDLVNYTFPTARLRQCMSDASRTPLLLVACGSFSPITYLHLRMFEMAADYAKYNSEFEVVGGYLSPVSDAYRKAGLANAEHRVAMTRIATEQSSKWLDVDPWEAIQRKYQPTAVVLDHFEHEINEVQRGIATRDGERKAVRIVLLAGADLIQTMSTPGVWSQEDLDHILGKYGVFIVERTGTDIDDALATLTPWRHNIWVIQQLIQNDVSSTKIRLFLKREMSVRYLVPAPVINYIEEHGLYEDDGASSSIHEKGKDVQAKEATGTSTSR